MTASETLLSEDQSEDQNHAQEIQDFIASLASQPDREAVAIELGGAKLNVPYRCHILTKVH
jgi:hypothetical protein